MKNSENSENSENWYNPQKMLSYNQYVNLIIGGRGIGKTFALKKHLLKKFLKTGKQFIYLRRNKSELDRIDKEKFFTTELLKQVFKNFEMLNIDVTRYQTKLIFNYVNLKGEVEEGVLIISSSKIIFNGKILCYMKSLSTWVDLKGSEYDEVDDILFDEILIDTASRKYYLKNEVAAFLNFLYSVFRKRKGCKAYLLSNATNFNNPYFAFLGFYEKPTKRFYNIKNKAFLIEFPPNNPFESEEEQENPFYKLIKDSEVYGSMVDNDFQILKNKNIIDVKGNMLRLFSFYVDFTFITCYYIDNRIYVKKGYDKNYKNYVIKIDEVENGHILLNKSGNVAKQIKKNYLDNIIFYENLEIKNKFLEVINYVI